MEKNYYQDFTCTPGFISKSFNREQGRSMVKSVVTVKRCQTHIHLLIPSFYIIDTESNASQRHLHVHQPTQSSTSEIPSANSRQSRPYIFSNPNTIYTACMRLKGRIRSGAQRHEPSSLAERAERGRQLSRGCELAARELSAGGASPGKEREGGGERVSRARIIKRVN